MGEERVDDLIGEGLDCEDGAGRVVLCDGAFPFVVFGDVGLGEEVVDNLPLDNGAVIMVEVGLLLLAMLSIFYG